MNDNQYRQYNLSALAAFSDTLTKRTRDLPDAHPLQALARDFETLASAESDLYPKGHALIARLFTTFTDFAPTFPRHLLWFFGGDCLHYLTDEEIREFQQLDESRLDAAERGENLDVKNARTPRDTLH